MALPSKKFKLIPAHLQCVGCRGPVTPGLDRTGSVVIGIQFTSHTYSKLASVDPVTYSETTKRIAYFDRKKGTICPKCASNYHQVTYTRPDGTIASEPIVLTDATPGFIGETIQGESATKRPREKGLNTRYTR